MEEITLNCKDIYISRAAHFGGSLNINENADNKKFCKGFSSRDNIITTDCSNKLKHNLQKEMSEKCEKKNKCKVNIDMNEIKTSCTDYLNMDIYLSYSCYGK